MWSKNPFLGTSVRRSLEFVYPSQQCITAGVGYDTIVVVLHFCEGETCLFTLTQRLEYQSTLRSGLERLVTEFKTLPNRLALE